MEAAHKGLNKQRPLTERERTLILRIIGSDARTTAILLKRGSAIRKLLTDYPRRRREAVQYGALHIVRTGAEFDVEFSICTDPPTRTCKGSVWVAFWIPTDTLHLFVPGGSSALQDAMQYGFKTDIIPFKGKFPNDNDLRRAFRAAFAWE